MFLSISGVRELCNKFIIVKGEDSISKQANANATTLISCLVRSVLCSKKVIEEYRLSGEAFEWILGEIDTRYQQANVRHFSRLIVYIVFRRLGLGLM
jgi:DNA-directed RNA polymerase II subunit RPB1